MNEDYAGEVVEIGERPPTQVAIAPRTIVADLPITQCPTSLDLTRPEHKALAFAAGNPGDYTFNADGTCTIRAVHWLIMPDEAEDPETGEIRQFGRLILFDATGRFFRTSSVFAPRRLKAAVELYSPAEWAEGVPFFIRRRTSQRGRTYHDIRILAR